MSEIKDYQIGPFDMTIFMENQSPIVLKEGILTVGKEAFTVETTEGQHTFLTEEVPVIVCDNFIKAPAVTAPKGFKMLTKKKAALTFNGESVPMPDAPWVDALGVQEIYHTEHDDLLLRMDKPTYYFIGQVINFQEQKAPVPPKEEVNGGKKHK